MNESKEIKQYYKNNELDLENIIEDFTPYISKIIDNMARESLNNENKKEIASDVFFILWKNKEKLNINKYMSSYLAGITIKITKTVYAKDKNKKGRWYIGSTKTEGSERMDYIQEQM